MLRLSQTQISTLHYKAISPRGRCFCFMESQSTNESARRLLIEPTHVCTCVSVCELVVRPLGCVIRATGQDRFVRRTNWHLQLRKSFAPEDILLMRWEHENYSDDWMRPFSVTRSISDRRWHLVSKGAAHWTLLHGHLNNPIFTCKTKLIKRSVLR